MFTYEEVSNIDIMTKTQRERMMNFANNKKGKPPIWYDDVPWDGYRNDVLQFTNEWIRGPIHIKEIALELLIGFIIALLIEICIVGPCAKKLYSCYRLINRRKQILLLRWRQLWSLEWYSLCLLRNGYDVFTWWTARRLIRFNVFLDFY